MTKKPQQPEMSGRMYVGGDNIQLGDVKGSNLAVGEGAQVITNIVERALSSVELADQAEASEHRRLAEAVVDHLKSLKRLVQEATQTHAAQKSPYKGALVEYDIGDAALFYGRLDDINEVLSCVEKDQLTVLHAQSGAGKTSLLKAGIMSRLLANKSDVPLYVRPIDRPVHEAVKAELLPQIKNTPRLAETSLRDFLYRVTKLIGKCDLVILVDQFEEVFAQQERHTRDEFARQLADCLGDDRLRVRWIIALRNEAFSHLSDFGKFIKHVFANEYRLPRLTRDQARDIIIEPARFQNIAYQKKLVDTLIADLTENGSIAPPQLQLVCSTLFEGLGDRKKITLDQYNDEGGARGILRSHLDRVLRNQVPSEQLPAARRLLEALILMTPDGKRRARRTDDDLHRELRALGIERAALDTVLGILIDSHLLRVDKAEERDRGGKVYELVHDYLLEEIELDPAVQERKAVQEILEQEVHIFKQYPGTTLDARRLTIVEAHLPDLAVSKEAQALIEASRAEQQALQQVQKAAARRRRMLFAGVGLAVIGVLTYLLIVLPLQRAVAIYQARGTNPPIGLNGGEMVFGSTSEHLDLWEHPEQIIEVSRVWLQTHEVTNAEYALCAKFGSCTAPNEPPGSLLFDPQARADYPVVYVSAVQASTYCEWIGMRLPTELEWERAARGLDGRAWPWSEGGPTEATAGIITPSHTPSGLLPVESYPEGASPEGLFDLVGNAWEWTATEVAECETCPGGFQTAHWDGEPDASLLILRGGAWNAAIDRITQSATRAASDTEPDETFGFRCAADAPPQP